MDSSPASSARAVTKVGRNDACPCGSGLKCKKCCLSKSAEPFGAYSSGERQAALDGLFGFAASGRFRDTLEDADLVFWGGLADDLSAEDHGSRAEPAWLP